MGVSTYCKRYYEDFYAFGLRKNKANLLAFSVLRSADSAEIGERAVLEMYWEETTPS